MQNQPTQEDFPKALEQIFQRYGLTYEEDSFLMSMMELAYQAGTKNAWGESSQEAVLLHSTKGELEFPKIDELWTGLKSKENTEPTYTLTQPQVNYLRPILSKVSRDIQNELKFLKEDEQYFYEHSDNESPLGALCFNVMNSTRNEIKRLRRHQHRINSIIRALKYGDK